jgi:hypothetical protein
MGVSGSFGRRTTNFINSFGTHKFYIAGAATALPVFFIAAGSQISGHSGTNNTPKSSALPVNNMQAQPAQEHTSNLNTSNSDTAENGNNAQQHSDASVTIDGQSISASTDGTSDQSVHKSLNTANGSASISIDQQHSSSSATSSSASVNVQTNSQSSDSNNSLGNTDQYNSGENVP